MEINNKYCTRTLAHVWKNLLHLTQLLCDDDDDDVMGENVDYNNVNPQI